jgi:hypothetical protein
LIFSAYNIDLSIGLCIENTSEDHNAAGAWFMIFLTGSEGFGEEGVVGEAAEAGEGVRALRELPELESRLSDVLGDVGVRGNVEKRFRRVLFKPPGELPFECCVFGGDNERAEDECRDNRGETETAGEGSRLGTRITSSSSRS